MTRKKRSTGKPAAAVHEPKVAMSYRLAPGKIARARAILGTPSATATIEEALDLVVFRRELMEGAGRAFGLPIADAFPAGTPARRR
jgi:hypothetical protein